MWMLIVNILRFFIKLLYNHTKLGKYLDGKIEKMKDWIEEKYDIELDKKELTRRNKYPKLSAKMDNLEAKIAKIEEVVDLGD